jgi:hypothetical protein
MTSLKLILVSKILILLIFNDLQLCVGGLFSTTFHSEN